MLQNLNLFKNAHRHKKVVCKFISFVRWQNQRVMIRQNISFLEYLKTEFLNEEHLQSRLFFLRLSKKNISNWYISKSNISKKDTPCYLLCSVLGVLFKILFFFILNRAKSFKKVSRWIACQIMMVFVVRKKRRCIEFWLN